MEAGAKFSVKGFRVISHDIEAAAFHRSLGTESADNDVTTRFEGQRDITNISEPILWVCQEVKNRAIMPHIE